MEKYKMSEQTDSFTMPSNPADRKKIKDMLYEMSGMLQFIQDKREDIKSAAESLEEEFGVPKKISTKMARVLHKNNYSDIEQEADQFTTIFETLFQSVTTNSVSDDQDSD